MKKALYIFGMFLIVQYGSGILLVLMNEKRMLSDMAGGAAGHTLSPQIQLLAMMLTSLVVISVTIFVCGKGVKEIFRWKGMFSSSAGKNSGPFFANFVDGKGVFCESPERFGGGIINKDFGEALSYDGADYRKEAIGRVVNNRVQGREIGTQVLDFNYAGAQRPEPEDIGVVRKRRLKLMCLALAGMLPLMFLANVLNEVLQLPNLLGDFIHELNSSWWALLAMALIGPLGEEICFRHGVAGSLLQESCGNGFLERHRVWVAVIVSALMFSIVHMNPAQLVVAFLFGVYFGWLYVISGSVWPSICCHVLNNGIALLLMRMLPREMTYATIFDDGALFLMVALTALIMLFIVIRAIWMMLDMRRR